MARHPQSDPQAYNDLRAIFRLRDLLADLDPGAPPVARVVYDPSGGPPERFGVLSGSFNPLTKAHLALAHAARAVAQLPAVYFLLSKVTVDKERAVGALPEDRLRVLECYAAAHRGFGVVGANRGLYVEQAEALHRQRPGLSALYFVVGYDKIVQIFDPRYYADRDAALHRLFALASFLVAPRAGHGPEALVVLLARPENRPFREQVTALPMPPDYVALSSSLLRERAAAGESIAGAVPAEVHAFVEATGAYRPPLRLPDGEEIDRYALRAALIAALGLDRPRSEEHADLPRLLSIAWSDTAEGRHLRTILRRPPAAWANLLRRLSS